MNNKHIQIKKMDYSSKEEDKNSKGIELTNSVCSNWALRLPSAVTAVQSSGHSRSFQTPTQYKIFAIMLSTEVLRRKHHEHLEFAGTIQYVHLPALIIGSIVNVCPAFMMPTALFPTLNNAKTPWVQLNHVPFRHSFYSSITLLT
jgi:hypothetical protein